jgi:hypothetical protein
MHVDVGMQLFLVVSVKNKPENITGEQFILHYVNPIPT